MTYTSRTSLDMGDSDVVVHNLLWFGLLNFNVRYPCTHTTLHHEHKDIYSKPCTLITERLSARLLIVQCSQFTFVCMYICMYICHTLIVWVQFLWSRPQTTSHVALIWPGGDQRMKKIVREPKWSRGHMVLVWPGGNQLVKKIVRESKWSRSSPSKIMLERVNRTKGTLHQKRVRQKRRSLMDWGRSDVYRRLSSLPETL